MPRARASQISLTDTPYYHCVSRCVRRAYLCGQDKLTGQSYEHRREWVEERLHLLAQVFTIDVCAYAVMSNHTHVVLHVDKSLALSLSIEDIFARWHTLFNGTLLTQKYRNPATRLLMSEAELFTVKATAEVYRQRLFDISWFMRALNEWIARQANQEDNCTGRFWEGRYKSQALLDDAALLSCMAYVDLNPVRASMAMTPEQSLHTSIRCRVICLKNQRGQPGTLMPFVGSKQTVNTKGLQYSLKDYLELVDRTGRCIRANKIGAIEQTSQPVLTRLGLAPSTWLTLTTSFEKRFCYAAGQAELMRQYQHNTQRQKIRGMANAKSLLCRS